jgi:2-keto-4-pentenoate hydratase/2-oxohepta-3-ene-1,7-dioic acid hydratase in catechol pathway
VLKEEGILVGKRAGLLELLTAGRRLEEETLAPINNESVEPLAPLRPPVLLCCGQNYSDHLAEQGEKGRAEPEFFLKAGQTISDPGQPFVLDRRLISKLDYETELAVVVGHELASASIAEAAAAIFGYLVMNDLSARERQLKPGGRTALGPGKNFDGATRLSPWVVTADEIPDPQRLSIGTAVNGEARQANTTANMIYGCAEIAAAFSRFMTLLPGTIIATGTPGGTGLGCDAELGGRGLTPVGCEPARYLAAGDLVTSRIESVGELTFSVIDQPAGVAA